MRKPGLTDRQAEREAGTAPEEQYGDNPAGAE